MKPEMVKQTKKEPLGESDFIVSVYETIGQEIGALTAEKNRAYNNSLKRSGEVLKVIYPDGIKPDQYKDAAVFLRMFDKFNRIAADRGAFGENPYRDIAGYAILMSVEE